MPHNDKIISDYKLLGTYYVKVSLYGKYNAYSRQIQTLLSENKPIPAILLKRFFAIVQHEDTVKGKQNRKQFKKGKDCVKKVMDYFSQKKNEDYLFSGKSKQKVPPQNTIGFLNISDMVEKRVEYSFGLMIENCIGSYFILGTQLDLNNDGVIRFFADSINGYCNLHLNSKHKREFTNYKRRVTAAYLTICIGRRLFDITKEKFTNRDLFQATRNALRPKKRKA